MLSDPVLMTRFVAKGVFQKKAKTGPLAVCVIDNREAKRMKTAWSIVKHFCRSGLLAT